MAKQFERILSLTGADFIVHKSCIMCLFGIQCGNSIRPAVSSLGNFQKKPFFNQPLITYKFQKHNLHYSPTSTQFWYFGRQFITRPAVSSWSIQEQFFKQCVK